MMLVLDKQVVANHIEDMAVGVSMLFVAYFVFNIKFPGGPASTLEFIQRYDTKQFVFHFIKKYS